jgi:hypothetical protein
MYQAAAPRPLDDDMNTYQYTPPPCSTECGIRRSVIFPVAALPRLVPWEEADWGAGKANLRGRQGPWVAGRRGRIGHDSVGKRRGPCARWILPTRSAAALRMPRMTRGAHPPCHGRSAWRRPGLSPAVGACSPAKRCGGGAGWGLRVLLQPGRNWALLGQR